MLPRGLIREHLQVVSLFLRCLDVVAIVVSGLSAYYFKFGNVDLSSYYVFALASASCLTAMVFQFFHIYESMRGKSVWQYIRHLVQAILVVLILLAGLAFITKTSELYSRSWYFLWMFFSIVLLIMVRLGLLLFLRFMRSYGWNERRVVVIGIDGLGANLIKTIQQALWTGFRVTVIFDDHPEKMPSAICGIPVQKTPESMSQFLENDHAEIDEVWLALPLREENRVKEILYEIRHHTVTIRYVLDIFGLDLLNHSITDLAGFPVLNIRSTPMKGWNRLFKAVEDRLLAFTILLLASPFLLSIAFAVKLTSKGPIFYRQKRVGWNGKEFNMLKFRSMPVDAEAATGPVWAKANENRVTKLGAFLRRTSLDELPQFINVLKGDMSIVGPRPERLFFVEQFKNEIPRYMQKHLVKAGITGWAQVNGWRGNTSLEKRIEYDLFYIENWSLLFDLKIILLTFFSGFINKNAY